SPINTLQVLSHLMLSCRTLRHALEAFQRHAPYVAEGSAWEIYERQNLVYLYYERALANDDVARIVADGVIASIIRLGRFFVPGFRAEEIWFRHPAPSYADRYTQLFNCTVRFDKPRNAVICDRELLDRPQFHADDTMLHVLHETASRLLRPSGEQRGLAEKVRVLLANDSAIGTANIESLARRLGMSQRTLRRRLAEEGCRFTLLLDEVRCDLACAELHKGDGSIKAAAERVGFSERSSFHRAFKRWTGKTPLEYVNGRPAIVAASFA
ncbi:MAG TPA: AraC family transcriptional regulator ligand-binding domain-containing protein, partial [Polyangiales bacterium]